MNALLEFLKRESWEDEMLQAALACDIGDEGDILVMFYAMNDPDRRKAFVLAMRQLLAVIAPHEPPNWSRRTDVEIRQLRKDARNRRLGKG